MQSVDLELDSDNELNFMVKVEGSRPGESSCRLMIEGPEMSYTFPGTVDGRGEVTVVIPSMERVLKEGTYKSDLEVIVDDRIFKPLSLSVNFEKTVKVTAEAVVPKKRVPKVTASATFVAKEADQPIAVSKPPRAKEEMHRLSPTKPRRKSKIDETKEKNRKQISLSDLNENELRTLIRGAFLKKG